MITWEKSARKMWEKTLYHWDRQSMGCITFARMTVNFLQRAQEWDETMDSVWWLILKVLLIVLQWLLRRYFGLVSVVVNLAEKSKEKQIREKG